MKRYLLDTRLIYWWMTGHARLGKATQRIIAKSEIVVSTASVWEMELTGCSSRRRGTRAIDAADTQCGDTGAGVGWDSEGMNQDYL